MSELKLPLFVCLNRDFFTFLSYRAAGLVKLLILLDITSSKVGVQREETNESKGMDWQYLEVVSTNQSSRS